MVQMLEFPGFIDVHVHFRDPGVPEAETTKSGLVAAANGGFAAVVTMPNTSPACDSPDAIHRQLVRVTRGLKCVILGAFGIIRPILTDNY